MATDQDIKPTKYEVRGILWICILAFAFLIQYLLVKVSYNEKADASFVSIGFTKLLFFSSLESLFEEVAFRFLPIYLVYRYQPKMIYFFTAVIVSSILFGIYHLNSPQKGTLIVAGFIYGITFLLSGGLLGNFKRATLSTWLLHAALNLSWITFQFTSKYK